VLVAFVAVIVALMIVIVPSMIVIVRELRLPGFGGRFQRRELGVFSMVSAELKVCLPNSLRLNARRVRQRKLSAPGASPGNWKAFRKTMAAGKGRSI
jgi:hypothetical protein